MSHPVDWVLFAWTFLGLKEQQASPSPLLCSLYHQEEKFQKALGATVPLAQLDRGTLFSEDRLLSKGTTLQMSRYLCCCSHDGPGIPKSSETKKM